MTVRETRHPFDVFFEKHSYADGEEPQAFADWLSSLTGEKVVGVGLNFEGVVEGLADH